MKIYNSFLALSLAVIILFFIPINSNAQCPSCDAALKRDTRDYYQNQLKTNFTSVLTQIFNHDFIYYQDGDWTKNTEFQSGGAYGIISGFLNGSQSSTEKETKFQAMKTLFGQTHDIEDDQYRYVSQSLQSPTIYKNWIECIKSAACTNVDMPILESDVADDEVTITLYWQHNNTNDKESLRDIQFGNMDSLKGGSLFIKQNIQGRNSYSKSFRILNIHKSSFVTVTMTDYPPAKIVISAVPREIEGSNYPVGTIIASVLDFDRFCHLNGQPLPVVYDDSLRCKWVPADGRFVSGSRYSRMESKVPDLRGVFLRGLNDFGVISTDVQTIDTQHADLDDNGNLSNRTANSFELDQIKNHKHSISLAAGGNTSPGNALEAVGRANSIQINTTSTFYDSNHAAGAETKPKNIAVYYYIKIN